MCFLKIAIAVIGLILKESESFPVEVFSFNEAGLPLIRIPSIVRLANGSLLAVVECGIYGRVGDDCVPDGYKPPTPPPPTPVVPLCSKLSHDGGKTWGQFNHNVTTNFVHSQNPTMVWDEIHSRALMFFNVYFYPTGSSAGGREVQLWQMWTRDGLVWSSPTRVDDKLAALSPPRNGSSPGPGTAVQLRGSAKAPRGRILLPLYLDGCGGSSDDCVAAVYTDDYGETWQNSFVPVTSQTGLRGWFPNSSESVIAETAEGEVVLNMRTKHGYRGIAVSGDGGKTFSAPFYDKGLLDPACQGSLLALQDGNILAFSDPRSQTERTDITVMIADGRANATSLVWQVKDSPAPGQGAAYSSLVDMHLGNLGILYEGSKEGAAGHACAIRFTVVSDLLPAGSIMQV